MSFIVETKLPGIREVTDGKTKYQREKNIFINIIVLYWYDALLHAFPLTATRLYAKVSNKRT